MQSAEKGKKKETRVIKRKRKRARYKKSNYKIKKR
jgi:hypothetical protein